MLTSNAELTKHDYVPMDERAEDYIVPIDDIVAGPSSLECSLPELTCCPEIVIQVKP
jgi:hypothetical protein